ncbi:recombinase family protein [Amycolatopsis thailandensis]|uniref:recombinase family protein n=1 Tax=Amycolatopsis thailandensis TaxID=589330 RepID=UPI00363261A2
MRFGYARVSVDEPKPETQSAALVAAGVPETRLFVDKVAGKSASRPMLDKMLGELRRGDEVVVTRLIHLGRSRQHLVNIVRRIGDEGVDFVVLEQNVDTAAEGGRQVFAFLDALADFEQELIVLNGRDDALSSRGSGRMSGRRPRLNPGQVEQVRAMYESGDYTVDEVAKTFQISRPTLYRYLYPYRDGSDCAFVIYRKSGAYKVDADTNQHLGETGQGEELQREADRKWWPIAENRQPRLRAIVYVVDGIVRRVRGVEAQGRWERDERRYADVPVTPPLTKEQIARQLPTLGFTLGDIRPHVRGKIREYVPL